MWSVWVGCWFPMSFSMLLHQQRHLVETDPTQHNNHRCLSLSSVLFMCVYMCVCIGGILTQWISLARCFQHFWTWPCGQQLWEWQGVPAHLGSSVSQFDLLWRGISPPPPPPGPEMSMRRVGTGLLLPCGWKQTDRKTEHVRHYLRTKVINVILCRFW